MIVTLRHGGDDSSYRSVGNLKMVIVKLKKSYLLIAR